MTQSLPRIKSRFHTQSLYRDIINSQNPYILNRNQSQNYHKNSLNNSFDQYKQYHSININPSKRIVKKRVATQNSNFQKRNQQIIPEEIIIQGGISHLSKNQIYIQTNKKHSKKSRLQNLIKKMENKKAQQQENLNNSLLKHSRRYNIFQQHFKKLPKKLANWSYDQIIGFINLLSDINPFFKKVNQIVSLCLLKIGKVKIYNEKSIIQKQDDFLNDIGIILWGQILLKSKQSPLKIYLFPGDSLNQQLIFKNQNKDNLQKINLKTGYQSIRQTAKAKTQTGIVFLKIKQYKQIFKQLTALGQKNNILTAENIMKWSYSKKKNLRKQFLNI